MKTTIPAARLARVLAPAVTVAERDARNHEAREWTGRDYESSFGLDERCEAVRVTIRKGARPLFGGRR